MRAAIIGFALVLLFVEPARMRFAEVVIAIGTWTAERRLGPIIEAILSTIGAD